MHYEPTLINSKTFPRGSAFRLSEQGERCCRQVWGALANPGVRASVLKEGALPAPLARTLGVLDDRDFQAASDAIGHLQAEPALRARKPSAEVRLRRRGLFLKLRDRYPEAVAAFLAARGRSRLDTITTYFLVWQIVGPVFEANFDGLEDLA